MTNQKKLKAIQSVSGQVTLPGSKSITNRILLLSAIADGETIIKHPLQSDDTHHMIEALKILQVDLSQNKNGDIHIKGSQGQFKNKSAEIFLGNAGTAFRPLTAALSFSQGNYILSGVPRMHERPIKDLVDALLQLNANITYLNQEGYPPLKISPSEIIINSSVKIRGDISSQFLTALLMAIPLTKKEVSIEIIGDLISKPYIDITLNLMSRFGVHVKKIDWQHFVIPSSSAYVSPGIAVSQIRKEGIYKAALIERMKVQKVKSEGYCFQIEMTRAAQSAKAIIAEFPITFKERETGSSKMSSKIVVEAMLRVTIWGFERVLGRSRG